MANDYGVRENLRNAGFGDNDIGYNQDTGYVTVKGQNFLKPELNMNGTTYTNQSNFNNALSQYRTNERAANAQNLTNQYINNTQQPQANPYVDQYTQMIGQIRDIMSRPQQDVYSTPQYTAALAANNQAVQRANRQTQEAYGQSGFGRSTNVGDRIQRNSNDAEAYLQTQVVPQIQQQIAAQRQQEISNQMAMLDPVMALLNRQDTNQRNSNQDLLNVINLLDAQTQRDYTNRQVERDANLNAALQVGNQLGRVLQPKSDWSNLYNQEDAPLNMQGQQMEYQRIRDSIADEQYKQKFDEDVRRYGLDYGLQQAQLANQIASRQADDSRQNAALGLQREQFEWSKDPSNPANQYKMSQANNVGSNRTDNNNQFTSTVVSNLDQMTPEVRKKFFTDEKKTLVNQLGLSGYNNLYKQYFADDGNPK